MKYKFKKKIFVGKLGGWMKCHYMNSVEHRNKGGKICKLSLCVWERENERMRECVCKRKRERDSKKMRGCVCERNMRSAHTYSMFFLPTQTLVHTLYLKHSNTHFHSSFFVLLNTLTHKKNWISISFIIPL